MEQFVFHVPFADSTGSRPAVDEATGVIRGVSLMTGNLVAEGHDLEVDETTLKQVLSCAKATGKIPVKLDYGSGITSLCGYIDGATAVIDGAKVRGDWHLLTTHEQFGTIIERAKKMPECFGLSAAFKGKGEHLPKRGKKAARCEKLLSVDCVTQPAANPDGLFAARNYAQECRKPGNGMGAVDTRWRGMADENQNIIPADAPEWAKQLFTEIRAVSTKQAEHEQLLAGIQQGGNEPDLVDLANMSDEELAAAGFDVEAVHQAVDAAMASGELTVEGPTQQSSPNAQPGAVGGAAPLSTGSPSTGSGPAGVGATSMSAKTVQEIVAFEIGKVRQQARNAAEAEAAEHAFSVIEAKVTALSARNDELVELNQTLTAERDALRLTLRTSGVRAVAPGLEGPTLFAAKGAPAGSFEQIATAKFEELKGKAGMTEVSAKSQAIQFAVRSAPAAYQDYLGRGGKIELGK